jgi:membrane protease YdiL (CAAX protease family)
MAEFLLILVLTAIIGGIIIIANIADYKRNTRVGMVIVGVLLLINALVLLNGALTLASVYITALANDAPSETAGWGGFIASFIVSGLASVVLLRPVRERLAVLFPHYRPRKHIEESDQPVLPVAQANNAVTEPTASGEPLFPQMLNYYTSDSVPSAASVPNEPSSSFADSEAPDNTQHSYQVRGFNPASYVHMLALVLMVIVLGTQFVQFIVSGGLEGLAATYEDQGIDLLSLLSNSIPFVVLSFLGVGLGVRRNWRQTLERLGLRQLTIGGFFTSIGLAFALLMGLIIVAAVWTALVPQDVYEEQNQASEAISRSVTSVGLAFAIAASAAIGEELAFRGALQPVLGLWPTAIIFALMHPQYTLTPAALIILGVALAFGWVRQRYSTTVSILTHFWYNLIQLLALFLPTEQAAESLLHLFGR